MINSNNKNIKQIIYIYIYIYNTKKENVIKKYDMIIH